MAASSPSADKAAIADLINSINDQGQRYLDTDSNESRLSILESIAKLNALLETPADFVQKLGFAEPARNACVRTAVELGIFGMLKSSPSPLTVPDMAQRTSADSALVSRIMKHLAAMNVVAEAGQDRYTATTLSNGLTEIGHADGVRYTFDIAGPSFLNTPEYLKSTGYKNPGNIMDGPFQFGHKTEQPFFLYLNQRPASLEHFNHYMGGFRQGKAGWLDFYPAADLLDSASNTDSPFMVDVGGGLGHDLLSLRQKFADPERYSLVLQDRQEVISAVPLTTTSPPASIAVMAHDFFTPQPAATTNARGYFLHSVLHDWDDASCIRILKQLAHAMKPAYSKVLINEYIVPNTGATWPVTSMDWLMMALGAVKERTEAQFEELLRQAGLKITGVWIHDQGTEGIIEAELER